MPSSSLPSQIQPPPPLNPATIPAFPSQAAQDNARVFAGTTLVLLGVSLGVLVGRVWTRVVPGYRMQWDDYVCVFAYILILANSGLLLAAIPYTFTNAPTTFFLASAQKAHKYASIAQPLWAWSMASIKCSFALMLLRIEVSKPLRRFLWGMIALQLLLGIYNTLATLLQCMPMHKAWDLEGIVAGRCWSERTVGRVSISVSVVNIATDFVFALLPLSFLRQLRRPRRERVILGVLMGLGVFAGVASILKIVAAARFGRTGDRLSESVNIGMWSVVEELVGFIVICVPCLRSPFQRVLGYWGVLSGRLWQRSLTRGYGRTYDERAGEGESRGRGGFQRGLSRRTTTVDEGEDTESGFTLKVLRTKASSDEDGLWRDDGGRGKGEIWCTKEVTVENNVIGHVEAGERLGSGPRAGWLDESVDIADAARCSRVV